MFLNDNNDNNDNFLLESQSQYVGSTATELKVRFRNHKSAMITNHKSTMITKKIL